MKKLLFTTLSLLIGFGAFSQEHFTAKKVGELPQMLFSQKAMIVEDTLTQPVFGTADSCDPRLYTFTGANGIITGTYPLSTGPVITEVGQLLNLAGDSVEVESFLVFVNNKAQGPSGGSFTASLYDTVGGPSALRPDYTAEATSQTISFANIDTVFPGINRFALSTPYQIAAPFWATLDTENNSDTISVYSTSDDCGGGGLGTSIMNLNDTLWVYYPQVFANGNDGLDIALWIWAEVDTAGGGGTVGLDPNMISNNGLDFYPNPATDRATIEFHLSQENKLSLVIQDMSGREVYRTEKSFGAFERKFELDLNGFETGPYTYQVIGEKRQLNGVFIKK